MSEASAEECALESEEGKMAAQGIVHVRPTVRVWSSVTVPMTVSDSAVVVVQQGWAPACNQVAVPEETSLAGGLPIMGGLDG